MSNCIVTTVNEWLNGNCTEYSRTQGQEFFTELIGNFYSDSGRELWIPGVNDRINIDSNLNFQNLLVDVCNTGSNGKYCREPFLNICSRYTRQDASNPIVKKLCGCYLPDTESGEPERRSCDTICSAYDNLKYHEEGVDTPQTCNANLCIIDNFTLIAKGSSIGDITFSQTCPFCTAGANCKCIIGDINIIAQDSRMGSLQLEQNCTGGTECYTDNNGVRTEVDCNMYLSTFGLSTSEVKTEYEIWKTYTWAFLLFAILFGILFIVTIVLTLITPEKTKTIVIKPDQTVETKIE